MLPILTTKRLQLEQVEACDQQFIFEGLSHPDVILFYGVRYHSFEETGKQMEWYDKNIMEGTGGAWKIINTLTGDKMGVVAYYSHKAEHKKAEIGFWLFPHFWKQGFISEALKPVIDYCQKEKSIHRIEAFVEAGNVASCRVLEKAGFQYEGKMVDCEVKDGRYISLLIYALLQGGE